MNDLVGEVWEVDGEQRLWVGSIVSDAGAVLFADNGLRMPERFVRHIDCGAWRVSPRPAAGQTWARRNGCFLTEASIAADDDGELVVEGQYAVLNRGSSMSVARWLFARGFACVDETADVEEAAQCADDAAVVSVAVAGMDASRIKARAYVDRAIASLKGEPFIKAITCVLVALCEGHSPTAKDIDGAIAACRAWEECRGKVAPAVRALNDYERAMCSAAACRASWGAACEPSHPEIAEAVIGHYERARGL